MTNDKGTDNDRFVIRHSVFDILSSLVGHSTEFVISPGLRRCGVDDLHGDRRAERVGQAELVHPVLGPILRLIVLADLDEDRVFPGPEGRGGDMRILLEALVIRLAGEYLFAVEPDLESLWGRRA